MTGRGPAPSLVQVALSVVDLAATERWFRNGLGFWPAGGSRRLMRGPLASSVQGLPRVASTCWWMVDRNDFFQLEMFQFERPTARLMAHDARPCDVGYARIGVWAAEFDETLTRLARLGSRPLSDPIGSAGERRACVRNPDGVYVEIMEDDPLADAPLAVTRSACRSPCARSRCRCRISPGPQRSSAAVSTFSPPMSRSERPSTRRSGASRAHARTAACSTPVASSSSWCSTSIRSAGRGRRPQDLRSGHPQHRLRRPGPPITASSTTVRPPPARARTARRFTPLGPASSTSTTPDEFSIELLWMSERLEKHWGFTPRPTAERPRADTHAIERTVRIAAPAQCHVGRDRRPRTHVGMDRPRLRPADHRRGPVPDGRGSERLLKLFGLSVTEQVVAYEPPRSYRYRVTEGSPFISHQAEIRLRATAITPS